MDELLNKLQEHMLIGENILKWNKCRLHLDEKKEENNIKKNKSVIKHFQKRDINKSETFAPYQFDKLFWCYFVMEKGMDFYNRNSKHLFSIEQEFKFESISILRSKKSILKNLKISLQDVENNLIGDKKISLNTLHALCVAYDKSLVLKNKEIFFDYNYGSKYNCIEIDDKNIFLHLGDIDKLIATIKESNLILDNQKPLRAFSFYKVDDLKNMANKLNINIKDENHKVYKKCDLYELIQSKIKKLT